MKRSPTFLTWVVLGTLLVGLFVLRLFLGSVTVHSSDVVGALLGHASAGGELVLRFRLPVAVTCVLAGAGLAIAGLLMQTLFRNALAGPDVLGLTSGSSLAVAMLILTAGSASWGLTNPWAVAIASSLGAAGVFILIIAISQVVDDNTSLLIIGLMVAATASSVVGVLQYLSQADDLQAFVIWGLGTVGNTGWNEILVMTIVIGAAAMIALSQMKPLNSLLLGENYATTLGINVRRTRLLLLAATSITIGAVTAFCGPIAFVGLAVPHLVRLLAPTSSHRTLLPAVMLGGPIVLLFCDIVTQLPGSTRVLPLNAVTSLVGAPVVIWLVIRNRKVNL